MKAEEAINIGLTVTVFAIILGLWLMWLLYRMQQRLEAMRQHAAQSDEACRAAQSQAAADRAAFTESQRVQAQIVALNRKLDEDMGALRSKYQDIANLDAEIAKRTAAMEKAEADSNKRLQDQSAALRELYAKSRALQAEVTLLEGSADDLSFGLYKPQYNFDASDQFKRAIDDVYEQKKKLLRSGTAAICTREWTVGTSRADGKKLVQHEIKLMLRAFNGECDSAVAKVSWNSVTRMEERIKKAYQAVNELGAPMAITIFSGYLKLALEELYLTYEYELKKHEEQEEQKAIRERIREEERNEREFAKAKREAEADAARYELALQKAREEMEKASGDKLNAWMAKVGELQSKLAEASAKLMKSVSMAELFKSGYVYIISNQGSFGDDVFKIGMTRRLDPNERVDELSSASVPFPFDVHMMLFSENAVDLENNFHKHFDSRRVNLVNRRKEFFRIRLDEIEVFARQHHADVQLTKLAEAREYRETLAKISALQQHAGSVAEATPILPHPEEHLRSAMVEGEKTSLKI